MDVERTLLAPLLERVARRRALVRHEQVLDRIGVAAGTAQAEHMPVVDDLGLRRRNTKLRSSGRP